MVQDGAFGVEPRCVKGWAVDAKNGVFDRPNRAFALQSHVMFVHE